MTRSRTVRGPELGWWCLLLLILAAPATAPGAEFSALMLVKDGPKVMPGQIYVRDAMMRQEFIDERGQTITIVRPDRKVVWVILPRQRCYMEMPLTKRLPGQFIQIPPLADKRPAGKDRINGYDTDKCQVKAPVGGTLEIQTFWVAPQLGLPIKMECRTRQFSMEYQRIKEEKVPDRLFNLPPGLQKVTSSGAFADQVE